MDLYRLGNVLTAHLDVLSVHGSVQLGLVCGVAGSSMRSHLGNGHAYELVFFQVVPGTLHINILTGRKLGAHPIVRSGASFDVLTKLELKSLS
jgi:hypothetical protein